MAVIGKVLDPIIENALKKGEKQVDTTGDTLEGETLLSHLVNLTDGKPYFYLSSSPAPYISQDPKIIRDETFNIMIAGRDTVRATCPVDWFLTDNVSFFQTASTLTFMIYMLSQKPQVLKRLRQEILDHVGPSARPTHEDLRDLKYLRATINGTS